MSSRFLAVAATLALSATAATCVVATGGNPAKDPRFTTGRGLTGDVEVDSKVRFTGELLGADTSGVHLLITDINQYYVLFVPARGVQALRLETSPVARKFPRNEKEWLALRGATRFGGSIPAAALSALLRNIGRQQVDTFNALPRQQEDDFRGAARSGTERYHLVANAAADGFKRVGGEFPFMGEHWVSLPRVLDDRFDAAEPSVLIYVNVGGKRVLAGVGYTALLSAGESPPRSAAPVSAWHEHNGSVVEESLPFHDGGHGPGSPGTSQDSLRLAVLHAWVWHPNPAGMFETDNRALPLLRAARPVPADPETILGLTLAQDTTRYYAQTLRTALGATDEQARIIDSLVWTHHVRAARAETAALRAAWNDLWRDLSLLLPEERETLGHLRARLGT